MKGSISIVQYKSYGALQRCVCSETSGDTFMNKQPITVIHHSADFDGRFCEAIATRFLVNKTNPDGATFIGWDYGDPKLRWPDNGTVYVLDLSPECFDVLPDINEVCRRLIWIDHHKTAIDKWPEEIPGYRIDGVAACRLAWQWFQCCDGNWTAPRSSAMAPAGVLPQKQDFVDRNVTEPMAVRLAGEYDIWDKRDPNAEVFQFGLRSVDLTPDYWANLLDDTVSNILSGTGMEQTTSQLVCSHLLNNGRVLQRYQQESDASLMQKRSFTIDWEGLKFLCINHGRFNSLTFASAVKPEHDALLGFCWDGSKWTVSLYHAPHRTDIDLSAIASRYGGGGHRGACGFQSRTSLPWL
jgi:oligoribonuclease NrnB/cAMP/cGMP phosphodiesterase (DHH superfamily)